MSEGICLRRFIRKVAYNSIIVGYFIILALMVGGCNPSGNQGQSPIPAQSFKSLSSSSPAGNGLSAGTYKIGTDIPAGEYLLFSNSNSYFQISRDLSNTPESIIANDNFDSTRYVTVSNGQYFEFTNAIALSSNKAKNIIPSNGNYPPGMYKVGVDIPPGSYKAIPTNNVNVPPISSPASSSYIEIDSDSTYSADSIVDNDNFYTEKNINLADGQYVKLVNCRLQK